MKIKKAEPKIFIDGVDVTNQGEISFIEASQARDFPPEYVLSANNLGGLIIKGGKRLTIEYPDQDLGDSFAKSVKKDLYYTLKGTHSQWSTINDQVQAYVLEITKEVQIIDY